MRTTGKLPVNDNHVGSVYVGFRAPEAGSLQSRGPEQTSQRRIIPDSYEQPRL